MLIGIVWHKFYNPLVSCELGDIILYLVVLYVVGGKVGREAREWGESLIPLLPSVDEALSLIAGGAPAVFCAGVNSR